MNVQRVFVPTCLLLVLLFTVVPRGMDTTRYYEVSGTSAKELRESLNTNRPKDAAGTPHDGLTSWDIRWRFRTATSSSGCEVTSFDVSYDVVIAMPKWTDEAGAASSLVEQWRAFHAALTVHERGHRAIALDAVNAIRHAGETMPLRARCDEVSRDIDVTARGLVEQYRQKDRQYDIQTDHGRAQGARFP